MGETPLNVISSDENKCYMWVHCTGTDSFAKNSESDKDNPPNIVLYDYHDSRAGHCVNNYLQDFDGYLQVDGYAEYKNTGSTLVVC